MQAYPEILKTGDILAMYAGMQDAGHAVIESTGRDAYTPGGHLTLWTSMGRFDVPTGQQVTVLVFI